MKQLQLKQKTASKLKLTLPQLAPIEQLVHTSKTMTTVTIPERILMKEGVKCVVHFDFRCNASHA